MLSNEKKCNDDVPKFISGKKISKIELSSIRESPENNDSIAF